MRRVLAVAAAAVIAAAVTASASPLSDLSVFGYNPVANSAAVVVSGNARFTVLSNALVRMEYSTTATFEDGATLAVVNRDTPVPSFTQNVAQGVLTIKTSAVTVTYQTGQAFSSTSLTATTAAGANWAYGQKDDKNLLGTIKSLDLLCNPSLNCDDNADIRVHSESLHCTWGVVSQNGWAVYDDTNNYLMSVPWFNNSARAASAVDIYFFGHGTNYKGAVQDLNRIAGKQPLTHRNLYGSWFTRWFDYDNDDVEKIIANYKQMGLPLDVLILDMNWHKKDSWTGYSWDKELYPIPNDTVAFAHAQGLRIGANLHDAVGFGPWEDQYATMAATAGIDPASGNTVPFLPLSANYMHTMEDQVLKGLGFDIWWIDWQQGGNYGGCDGNQLNPTFITDHVRSTDSIRRGENKRDQILARWGGMGTQRYPVGFSGDVSQVSWECFQYQPYFSATAANVGYGHISNDLVGPSDDHELHVRWMQFGSYSPILRIHDRGMSSGSCWGYGSCGIVDIWLLPYKYASAIRDAMLERSALQPYIYTAQRQAFDTGVTMVRPMYYDFPAESAAYTVLTPSGGSQYMFGDDMFVNVITQASGQDSGLVHATTWIPPGTWYDDVFGELVTGPSATHTRQYMLDDVPRFIRAGAVIPRVSNPADIGVAGQTYQFVDWSIYPGAAVGSGRMYEDDGASLDYITGSYTYTTLSYTLAGNTYTIAVNPANGSFNGQPMSRNVRIMLVGVLPLTSVSAGGQVIPYARFPKLGQVSYTYDGRTATAIIDLGAYTTTALLSVSATVLDAANGSTQTARAKLFAKRTMAAKRITDDYQATPFETVPGPGFVKQSAARAGYISGLAASSPQGAANLMGQAYWTVINQAIQELGGNPAPTPLPSHEFMYLIQLWDHSRSDMLLCADADCVATNSNYQVLWIEGWQPLAGDSGQTSLYDYYNPSVADNWATTQATPPADGYTAATFSEKAVFNAQSAGTGRSCIDVYWQQSTGDHLTTASPQGHQWARNHGYQKVNSCIGYLYDHDPSGTQRKAPAGAALERIVADIRKNRGPNGLVLPPHKAADKKKLGGNIGGANADPVAVAQSIYQSMTG